jgi:phosphoribosylanthranilate isomerase
MADIEAVNEYLPDYIGFVFASESRRQVSEDTARQLKAALHPKVKAIGVFVNDDPKRIVGLCKDKTIDIVQLHGDEGEEYFKTLRSMIPHPIIKAVRVKNHESMQNAIQYPSNYLLLDTYREKEYGGSGETFDWSLISNIPKPYFLAGGIHVDNVDEAIRRCHPYCIDISSGVETDGVKDSKKIQEIILKIRDLKSVVTQ